MAAASIDTYPDVRDFRSTFLGSMVTGMVGRTHKGKSVPLALVPYLPFSQEFGRNEIVVCMVSSSKISNQASSRHYISLYLEFLFFTTWGLS
jgi:hypothetical protein